MSAKEIKKEGFWKSNEEPNLPMPKSISDPSLLRNWKFVKGVFVEMLSRIEKAIKEKEIDGAFIVYRGYSKCRLCGILNGSYEFEADGWKWPEGYIHYLLIHNVKPSSEFMQFIRRL